MTCKICLDIFRAPKLLPCSHTFCQKCLDDVIARQSGGHFPCPTCREEIQVPAGGSSDLRNNNYLDSLELERARDGTHCAEHKKNLRLYCTACEKPICLVCKSTDHDDHKTEDLRKAAARAKGQLVGDKTRLEHAGTELRQRAEVTRQEQQTLQDKKAAVETALRDRHATLVAAADTLHEEELASLHALSAQLESGLAADLARLGTNLDEVDSLGRRLDQAVNSGAGCELLALAKEMRDGRGSQRSVGQLTSSQTRVISHPGLRFTVTDDFIVKTVRHFLGTVVKVEKGVAANEVTAEERFRCGEERDIEVFSLCPGGQGKRDIWVSYERRGLRKDAPSEKFDEKGKLIQTYKDHAGKVTHKSWANESVIHISCTNECLYTYDKSEKQVMYRVTNKMSGEAVICTEKVTSEDPFKTERKTIFRITVGAQRALAVDASEQLFVVVEEAQAPDSQRQVRLYRRPEKAALATYTPPSAAFQPSDVCFYRLGGQEVLLVSDTMRDAIHVVDVQQDGAMSFLRYLAPGCPLLLQPTALNTDSQGRLWVACRGGKVITMTPVA